MYIIINSQGQGLHCTLSFEIYEFIIPIELKLLRDILGNAAFTILYVKSQLFFLHRLSWALHRAGRVILNYRQFLL